MDINFTIYFGKSKSSEYENALEYAAMFENFTPIGPASNLNTIDTNNHEVLAKYHQFQLVKDTIGTWESAGVSYRDKEIDPFSFYLNIKDIAECALGYLKTPDKEVYCDDTNSNCWGCRQLSGIVLQHTLSAFHDHTKYWYQYGAFTDKTTWRINKEDITKALTDIVENKFVDFCPIFQYAFFRKIVAALPPTIDASDTKNWGQKYMDTGVSSLKQWEAASIYHKTSFSVPEEDSFPPGKDIVPAGTALKKAHTVQDLENKNLRFIPETTFADIGGIDDIIQKIREVIELPIKKPEIYDHLGIKPYRGILLWGEPGNGKTLIAKAIAHEVKAHFIPVVGPDILNKAFGESEKNIRDIFDKAREMQPSIIFFDEIDSIAQSRIAGETSKWYATVVNQLMSLMDGIRDFGNVTVLASTNRPDLLDPALMRPGRFDYKIEIKKPNLLGCKKVLEIATRGMPLADDADLFSFAEAVIGLSAAEITYIVKEAAMCALRRTLDVKSIIKENDRLTDFSHLYVKRSDLIGGLVSLKWNNKFVNRTYSLKG